MGLIMILEGSSSALLCFILFFSEVKLLRVCNGKVYCASVRHCFTNAIVFILIVKSGRYYSYRFEDKISIKEQFVVL